MGVQGLSQHEEAGGILESEKRPEIQREEQRKGTLPWMLPRLSDIAPLCLCSVDLGT